MRVCRGFISLRRRTWRYCWPSGQCRVAVLEGVLAGPGLGGQFEDRDGLHDIYRAWRQVADSYADPRVLIGEIWLPDAQRFARYLRPDELHTAFNLDFLARPWDAEQLRESIDTTLATHAPVAAPATWVLSNHDVTRPVTRYGRADTSSSFAAKHVGHGLSDLALGTHRARAAALLAMALPGSLYIYQGEELGLPEVENIPAEQRQDPMHFRSGGSDPGRDGCRIPMPWAPDTPTYGFSPADTTSRPWLPQPNTWASYSAAAQVNDPASMLSLYRAALRIRRSQTGPMQWLDQGAGVLAFRRDNGFSCVVNLGAEPVALPEQSEVLLASGELAEGALPTDTAVWLRAKRHPTTLTEVETSR